MTYTQTRRSRNSSSRRRNTYSATRPHFNRHTSNRRPHHNNRKNRKVSTFDVSHYINRNPAPEIAEAPYQATHTFADFGLAAPILRNLATAKHTAPTAIQDQIIPHILKGTDVVGLANTGSGKTAAFLLPLIHATLRSARGKALILTPTRELAIQIEQEFRMLARGARLSAVVCVGGMNIRPQLMQLKRHQDVIIGTPGRVLDLIERGAIEPHTINTVVLDEADRMLDMGFIHDMRTILKDVPRSRHTMLFSATMPESIEKLVHDFLREPVTVSVRKKDITANIAQDVIPYAHHEKFDTLVRMLSDREDFSRVIVFGAMKHSVEKLAQQLSRSGIAAESIHGNKSHQQRQRALKRFKDGHAQVLVATDVAARGIHVDGVSHVINYDLPSTYEDYVHRIGRTGRGTARGKALTFVARD